MDEYAPRKLQPGFIVLSYLVSLVGSWSTLELLQLRTATRGLYNWFLLIGSAVSMGGIAIWSMHFIGNRAIILYNDEPHLQLAYSQGYTVLSAFVPVVVLFGAYLLCGTGEDMSMLWVVLGGFGAGSSIAGMHYLGNAGIANYTCVYHIGFVIGSVIIAIAASTIALCIFFRLRKNFSNEIWKRGLAAVVLACGVSGMHWAGVVGTKYRSHETDTLPVNRKDIVILTLVMSLVACIGLLGFAVVAGRTRAKRKHRVQQVTLVSASFDEDGRILVHPDGTMPTATITDSFREKSFEESFGPNHWVFHWAFRTSSNWKAVADLIPGMHQHVRASLSHRSSIGSASSVEYHFLFREQFCVAAQHLADATSRSLLDIGLLHTSLLTSGYDPERRGTGKVLFLVSSVKKSFHPAGFRYAVPDTVLPRLADTMQVPLPALSSIISDMKITAKSPSVSLMPPSGVYLACLATRRQVSSTTPSTPAGNPPLPGSDLEILVDPHKCHQLPLVRLQESFLPAHSSWLRQHSHETVAQLLGFSDPTDDFQSRFSRCLQELERTIGDPFFRLAVLESSITVLANGAVRLIVFRANPTTRYNNPNLRFIPFGLFDAMQRDYDLHARLIHREFSGTVHSAITTNTRNVRKLHSRGHGRRWSIGTNPKASISGSTDLAPIVTDSSNFGSTNADFAEKSYDASPNNNRSFLGAGIMVSQSVTVDEGVPCTEADRMEDDDDDDDVVDAGPDLRTNRRLRSGTINVELRNLGTSARADADTGSMEPETWAASLVRNGHQFN